MSTNALDARATTVPDLYSSLEYLVAPIPAQLTQDEVEERRVPGDKMTNPGNELNNSLQKLTNLVYLLTERCNADDQSRTALTLVQAELAHLTVLVRKQAVAEKRTEPRSA